MTSIDKQNRYEHKILSIDGELKKGSRGLAVKILQQGLIDLGITSVGPADGIFGKGTEAALKKFQQKYANYSLPQTGVFETDTQNTMSWLLCEKVKVATADALADVKQTVAVAKEIPTEPTAKPKTETITQPVVPSVAEPTKEIAPQPLTNPVAAVVKVLPVQPTETVASSADDPELQDIIEGLGANTRPTPDDLPPHYTGGKKMARFAELAYAWQVKFNKMNHRYEGNKYPRDCGKWVHAIRGWCGVQKIEEPVVMINRGLGQNQKQAILDQVKLGDHLAYFQRNGTVSNDHAVMVTKVLGNNKVEAIGFTGHRKTGLKKSIITLGQHNGGKHMKFIWKNKESLA